jgi:broad specificity phosphatase PhoE
MKVRMAVIRYMSHPEVVIDAGVAVPDWGLSGVGRQRTRAMCRQPWLPTTRRIVSSPEHKALEAAAIVADHVGLTVEIRPGTGETDRSATGFVPSERHETLADAFFARPEHSAEGWERAVDVQARVAAALADLLGGDVDALVVGHGAAGTLWYCLLAGLPIGRQHDQPGVGHYFAIELPTRRPIHPWRCIDAIEDST